MCVCSQSVCVFSVCVCVCPQSVCVCLFSVCLQTASISFSFNFLNCTSHKYNVQITEQIGCTDGGEEEEEEEEGWRTGNRQKKSQMRTKVPQRCKD